MRWLTADEAKVLALLWLLFASVRGLGRTGLFRHLARRFEAGRFLALRLVVVTFFLSALVTNDVALITVVPLTLELNASGKGLMVILEALAANAGSALTPFGNPQNLYLYWYFHLTPRPFFLTVLPFVAFFFLLLAASSLLVRSRSLPLATPPPVAPRASLQLVGLLLLVFVTLKLLPFWAVGPVLLALVLSDPGALRVDYGLLLTLAALFAFINNLEPRLQLISQGHVFPLAALSSQILSNVPVAVMLSRVTTDWRALLLGVNAGGFGTPIASIANWIALKLYLASQTDPAKRRRFLLAFLGANALAFALAYGLASAILGRRLP